MDAGVVWAGVCCWTRDGAEDNIDLDEIELESCDDGAATFCGNTCCACCSCCSLGDRRGRFGEGGPNSEGSGTVPELDDGVCCLVDDDEGTGSCVVEIWNDGLGTAVPFWTVFRGVFMVGNDVLGCFEPDGAGVGSCVAATTLRNGVWKDS